MGDSDFHLLFHNRFMNTLVGHKHSAKTNWLLLVFDSVAAFLENLVALR